MNLISMDKKYKTRDGRDVRVLCVDADNVGYPVITLVDGTVYHYTKFGSCTRSQTQTPADLVEQPEEKTVWLEIFRYKHWSEDAKVMIGVHNSREELEAAVMKQQFGYQYIAIKKITYVEGEGIE